MNSNADHLAQGESKDNNEKNDVYLMRNELIKKEIKLDAKTVEAETLALNIEMSLESAFPSIAFDISCKLLDVVQHDVNFVLRTP